MVSYLTMLSSPSYLLFWFALIWAVVWKGFALWHSARNLQKKWFIVLLVVNTLGVLEIAYLFLFRKDRFKKDILGRKIKKKK
jgi:methionyl-tRNA synthetase